MDLDNINDIEVLREVAKESRVKMKEDISSEYGGYTFKKGYWYFCEQDEYYVTIYSDYSDDGVYSRVFTYKEAIQTLKMVDEFCKIGCTSFRLFPEEVERILSNESN